MHLNDAEIAAAHAWAAQIDACTCPVTLATDSKRYVVKRHTCPHCREWDKAMTDSGVTSTPLVVVPDRAAWKSKTRRRRAA